ncbi:MAG TPA: hypothetical protein VNG31_06860, partial [Candidatus Baltobacteraceae bacterium]|nr:hypothetical protein [Candidatus Baltobacteraceae bacterium]
MHNDPTLAAARLFLAHPKRPPETAVIDTLVRFGCGALIYAKRSSVAVALLRDGEFYRHASPALTRLGIDVDAWP